MGLQQEQKMKLLVKMSDYEGMSVVSLWVSSWEPLSRKLETLTVASVPWWVAYSSLVELCQPLERR